MAWLNRLDQSTFDSLGGRRTVYLSLGDRPVYSPVITLRAPSRVRTPSPRATARRTSSSGERLPGARLRRSAKISGPLRETGTVLRDIDRPLPWRADSAGTAGATRR